MDREELQGVLGHEMAHVRDYDIRTMMMIAVLVGGDRDAGRFRLSLDVVHGRLRRR